MFEIKDGYTLESQIPETMKLFGSTKKIKGKTKNEEKVPSLEVLEVALVKCNLVDSQINKSLKYYIFLHQINLMLIC